MFEKFGKKIKKTFSSKEQKKKSKKETIDPADLDEAREIYARLTNESRHIFKRTDKEKLKKARQAYTEQLQKKMEEVYKNEIPDEVKEALKGKTKKKTNEIFMSLSKKSQ